MSSIGWKDPRLVKSMKESDQDVSQHSQWWMGMNNGMSKCWLMQDGHDPLNTRYSLVDGAPWSFVFECKESSLPQEALDAVYLFSPHSMSNLRGAMVPTTTLVPRIESMDNGRKWKIVGVWKKREIVRGAGENGDENDGNTSESGGSSSSSSEEEEEIQEEEEIEDENEDDEDENEEEEEEAGDEIRSNLMRNIEHKKKKKTKKAKKTGGIRPRRNNDDGKKGIHDMGLDEGGMPSLNQSADDGTDLENVSPVRIEAWMAKVFHYPQDSDVTGEDKVLRKVFCILTVTPVRNFNLAEYLRHSIVENTQGTTFPGMGQSASEMMRKDRKDMLHRLLLGQMELCGFFNDSSTNMRGGIPNPLDALNMPSTDYYPANYLSIPMAYRRIQFFMHKQGYDHKKIYVEGFSDTVSKFTISDLRQVKEFNNTWAPSFYSAVSEFEALKPEERGDFRARLADISPPSWARSDVSGSSQSNVQHPIPQPIPNNEDNDDDDDVERGGALHPIQQIQPGSSAVNLNYVQKNRIPPIKVCLWYNPLMYMSPSLTRSEWEQQLGGFPAFFIYTMSRSIYSSATNPLLKPEYFMPEAKPMTTHARWHEYMDDGDNPLAGYCVAGWACRQFGRVMDASQQSINVSEVSKVQMVLDYMQTCFNMHLGLIDTKSLRSKTVYWAHRLMRESDTTAHHDLMNFLKNEMKLGCDTYMAYSSGLSGGRSQSGKLLADGGYAQVSYLHCESLNILNRDYFHLNDLNLSMLWRMLVTTTHHCVGINNEDLSAMGSSIIACRGGGHYTGKFANGNPNMNNGTANTYQALDKPNSVGGDYVVSHHSWMKNLGSSMSSSIRTFDNGQVPSDMTRFTEASMRMIGTVLIDERNTVRKEPLDNLLSQYYQTEMQITNVEQLKSLVMLLPRNMKQGSRGLAIDMSSADAEKTGERTVTKRLGVPGYLPHIVVVMTNMKAQLPEVKERLETAAIVMQRTFCGGPVDLSVGLYNCLMEHRKSGFAQYTWNAEKALGGFPKNTKGVSALYCTVYSASAYYSMLANKHGMYAMELSTLCKGLCRWIESICRQYLSHIFGKRQSRDFSRTMEIFKTVAASETNINYTVLMMLRSNTITQAIPKVMVCSMIDPIHIHEMPRMVYNFILNSISLPVFFAVSVFQREMEIPTIPLQSIVELFTNGSMAGCCVSSGRLTDATKRCTFKDSCHTRRIKDMLNRLIERRAFLPRESGAEMLFDGNCMPYITAYGNSMDRCDMSTHETYGKTRANASCMRGRPSKSMVSQVQKPLDFRGGRNNNDDEDNPGPAGAPTNNDENNPNNSKSESIISTEACKMFSKQCFQWYTKQFTECAMITEGEFCNSVEEFMKMSTKFAQFFGDLPFFGKHKTVMQNLGITSIPREFDDLTHKQVFEQQGQPILQARAFMSGEIALGIDWMCMLLLLSISGSSRIDQQLGKNVAMNLVGELFNKIPYTMFPYDAIHIKEFNPHMPSQEILALRPSPQRSGCIIRPDNRCVLDDTVRMDERILVPSCPLAPNLMMEDIGVASPLYDLCHVLGITNIYKLPIHLIPWPMPYPVGVPWPVIRYGELDFEEERGRGYVIVSPGGKAKLYSNNMVVRLNNVSEIATKHRMGPRPLFCTPCRAVRTSETGIGVLLPIPDSIRDSIPVSPPISGGNGGSVGGNEDEDEEDEEEQLSSIPRHPLSKLYDAVSDSFLCFDSETGETSLVEHQWVEENVLAMCSDILIKSWTKSLEKSIKHIGYKKSSGNSSRNMTEDQLRQHLEKDKVYIMGKIVPPRESNSFEQMVWVSLEVRHTVGNLKNMPNADWITIKVPPEDLRPMVDTSGYDVVEVNGCSSKKYGIRKTSSGNSGGKKRKGGTDTDVVDHQITINRFIFATKT